MLVAVNKLLVLFFSVLQRDKAEKISAWPAQKFTQQKMRQIHDFQRTSQLRQEQRSFSKFKQFHQKGSRFIHGEEVSGSKRERYLERLMRLKRLNEQWDNAAGASQDISQAQ